MNLIPVISVATSISPSICHHYSLLIDLFIRPMAITSDISIHSMIIWLIVHPLTDIIDYYLHLIPPIIESNISTYPIIQDIIQ